MTGVPEGSTDGRATNRTRAQRRLCAYCRTPGSEATGEFRHFTTGTPSCPNRLFWPAHLPGAGAA